MITTLGFGHQAIMEKCFQTIMIPSSCLLLFSCFVQSSELSRIFIRCGQIKWQKRCCAIQTTRSRWVLFCLLNKFLMYFCVKCRVLFEPQLSHGTCGAVGRSVLFLDWGPPAMRSRGQRNKEQCWTFHFHLFSPFLCLRVFCSLLVLTSRTAVNK